MALTTTGLLMRFRADDISGADLSVVSSWPSAVGGTAANQGTAASQPKLRTGALGGHNTVEFDGINDMLALSGSALDIARNRSNLAVFIAYKLPATAVANTRTLFAVSTGTTTGARLSVLQNSSNIHLAAGRRLDTDAFGSVASATGSTTGEAAVLTAVYRWSTSDLFLYKNGTQVASSINFQTAGVTSDTPSLTGFIGANSNGSAEWFAGQIAEILIYNDADLDGALRANVHTYLQDTYGIVSSDYLGPSVEEVPGFFNTYFEDFDTDIPEGGFYPKTTPGGDLGLIDVDAPAYVPYGSSFKLKANGAIGVTDTATYDANQTISVADSTFKIRTHYGTPTGAGGGTDAYSDTYNDTYEGETDAYSDILSDTYEGSAAATTPLSGAVKPLLPGANSVDQKYGRYVYRMRVTSEDPNWGMVADLIDPPTWPQGTGEYGHPENDFFDGPLGSWIHPANHLPDPDLYKVRVNYPQFALNDWHIYEIRWEPNRIRLLVNGVTVYDDQVTAPDTNLGFVIQSGAPALPAPGTESLIEIDWISIYAYADATATATVIALDPSSQTATATATVTATAPPTGPTATATATVVANLDANTAIATETVIALPGDLTAGHSVTTTVAGNNGTIAAVTLSGVTPPPAITGSGNTRSFIAPIVLVDTTLTMTVTDTVGGTNTQTFLIKAAPRRTYWNGAMQATYKVVVEE